MSLGLCFKLELFIIDDNSFVSKSSRYLVEIGLSEDTLSTTEVSWEEFLSSNMFKGTLMSVVTRNLQQLTGNFYLFS